MDIDAEYEEKVRFIIESSRKVEGLLKGSPYEVVARFLTDEYVGILEFVYLSATTPSINGPLEEVLMPFLEGARQSSRMLTRLAEVYRPAEYREAFPKSDDGETPDLEDIIRKMFGL